MTAGSHTAGEYVDIAVEGSPSMSVYVARPAAVGAFPGVVVGMELFGVSAHVRDVTERLAGLGFVAAAPDFYHRSAPGAELGHDEAGIERGFELLNQLTRQQALDDVRATMDYLRAGGSVGIGMVGLSVGGHIAYLAATELELELAAAVVLYGGWLPTTEIPLGRPEPTLARTAGITGRILVLCGENDEVVSPADRRAIAKALRIAGIRHEVIEYPGVTHGFLCDRRETFDPAAAQDAWRRIRELLAAELG